MQSTTRSTDLRMLAIAENGGNERVFHQLLERLPQRRAVGLQHNDVHIDAEFAQELATQRTVPGLRCLETDAGNSLDELELIEPGSLTSLERTRGHRGAGGNHLRVDRQGKRDVFHVTTGVDLPVVAEHRSPDRETGVGTVGVLRCLPRGLEQLQISCTLGSSRHSCWSSLV